MKLSKYFSLWELTKSQTASRRGINNHPNEKQLEALKALCEDVLDTIREKFGPFSPNSGFRSFSLNQAIRGSSTSQHMKGEAADIEIPGLSNYVLAEWIRDNLEFDQLILEFYQSGAPNSGWVHISYKKEGGNRKEILTFDGRRWRRGLYR